MSDRILDLSTGRSTPSVRIDGVDYQIQSIDSVPLKEGLYLRHAGGRISEIQKKLEEEYSDELADEFEEYLNRVVKLVLPDAPPEVMARLSDMQRVKIVEVFSEVVRATGGPGQRQQTDSSPDSADSMEGDHQNGQEKNSEL